MRANNLSTVSYAPDSPPANDEFARYSFNEFLKVKSAIDGLAAGHLDITHVAPTKPREGDLRYADGTNWNPASGKGFYQYDGTTWAWYPGGKTNSATIGAVTINNINGRCNIAAGGTSVVVTNSLVSASSNVLATIAQNDATATLKNVVAGSGSFTITLTAAATANTAVCFMVFN